MGCRKLIKIIQAYGHASGPSSLDEISKLVGMHTTIISRNAGFLLAIEIIQGGSKKEITQNGRQLAQALEHNIQDEVVRSWREVVDGSEFLSNVVKAVRIRQGMDEATLEAHIAYSAGQPKKQAVMTGARTIISLLNAAQLLNESDGKLVVTDRSHLSVSDPDEKSVTTSTPHSTPQIADTEVRTSQRSGVAIQLQVQLRVDCTPENLDQVGEKLRTLMRELTSEGDGLVGEDAED